MLEAYKMDFEFIEDETLRAETKAKYDASMVAVEEGLQAKIDAATEGLMNKNTELLGEKKTIAEKLALFKDITDPEKAMEALKFITENEDAQLIRDGKVDELISKRTSTMRLDHDNALQELTEKLALSEVNEADYKQKYETKLMNDAMRAEANKAGVRQEAITDILLRATSIFTLDSTGAPEARDVKGNLAKDKDDNVVTPSTWMEELKATSPHYWPVSEGAGALGGPIAVDADTTAKLAHLAKTGNMKDYRALRNKMKAA